MCCTDRSIDQSSFDHPVSSICAMRRHQVIILRLSLQEWIVASRVDGQDAFNVLKVAQGARDLILTKWVIKIPPPFPS